MPTGPCDVAKAMAGEGGECSPSLKLRRIKGIAFSDPLGGGPANNECPFASL